MSALRVLDALSAVAGAAICVLIVARDPSAWPLAAAALVAFAHLRARSERIRVEVIAEALQALREEADAAGDPSVSLVIDAAALAMARKVKP